MHQNTFLLFFMLATAFCQAQTDFLLEAESFADRGGWVIDQQFFDVMGSSYLLAHGLGDPVSPAVTKTFVDTPGKYHVWVRTKDWAPFPTGPGTFSLSIGQAYRKDFGSTGIPGWQWYGSRCPGGHHDTRQFDCSHGYGGER